MKDIPYTIAAVDFSESSGQALREALRISDARGTKLSVVHVVDGRVLDGLMERIDINEADLLTETKKRLHEFVQRNIGDRIEGVHLHVVHGHPFHEILTAVEATHCHLLVMGAHGSSNDLLRVGIIASKCVRKAPVDVLLVRGELPHGKKFHKILACVDFSENSERAARQALELAALDGAKVEFLNIYQPLVSRVPMVDFFGIGTSSVSDEEMVAAARVHLQAFIAPLAKENPGVEFTATVQSCHTAAGGITDYARDHGFDLVVLGTRGRTGLKRLLLGTTAEKIIHHSACSTLAVKPEGFHYDHA